MKLKLSRILLVLPLLGLMLLLQGCEGGAQGLNAGNSPWHIASFLFGGPINSGPGSSTTNP